MKKERYVPLALWIIAAVMVHVTGASGVDQVVTVLEGKANMRRLVGAVSGHVAGANRPVEIALLEQTPPPVPTQEPEPEPDKRDAPKVKPPKAEPPKAEEKKPAAEPPKPEVAQKAEEKKPPELLLPTPAKPPPPPPEALMRGRIAVQQQVDKEDQADNPNAAYIADQANHVAEETQAQNTSTDGANRDTSPGTNFAGPEEQPGNSERNHLGQDEDHTGDPSRVALDPVAKPPRPQVPQPVAPQPTSSPAPKAVAQRDGQHAQESRTATPAAPPSPDLVDGQNGRFAILQPSAPRNATAEQLAQLERLARKERQGQLGLGADFTNDHGVHLNLGYVAARDAIGADELAKERQADAERRRSERRGSWKTVGIDKWRSAIENYVPGVKPGNQTALNTARVPFASYLNKIHNRIHPIFAEGFLESLSGLPADNPLSRPDLKAFVEIVLERQEGRIVKMGITRPSGVTAFDVGALESVSQAAPFGHPPDAILSSDGNVYLHWEFYRDPQYACSTYFAHPYILKLDSAAPGGGSPGDSKPSDEPKAPPGQLQFGWLPATSPQTERHARASEGEAPPTHRRL